MITEDQYNELIDRLQRIEDRLTTHTKPPRRGGYAAPDTDLHRLRVAEVERIFWKLVNCSLPKRKMSYKFPKCLLENIGESPFEGVIVSVLINQASLRKVFKTRAKGDPANETGSACVKRALKDSNLFVVPTKAIRRGGDSETLVALSPAQAGLVVKQSILPAEWKGWTCEERLVPVADPFEAGVILTPPTDPSGVRVWGEDAPEPDATEPPVKVLNPAWTDTDEEEEEEENDGRTYVREDGHQPAPVDSTPAPKKRRVLFGAEESTQETPKRKVDFSSIADKEPAKKPLNIRIKLGAEK